MATYDEYLAQISQARTDIGQRIAGMPQFSTNLSESVYGKEGALPSLRTQASEKVRALYDTDKRMADRYANPSSEMYMKDPYARRKLTSAQHQQGLSEIQNLNNMIANRQDVLGSAIEKGLEIYKAGVDAQKFEYQGLMDELNMKMKIDEARRKATGTGTGTSGVKYTELVRLSRAAAPTTAPTNPGQTIKSGGFTYAFDPSASSWYAQELGPISQQDAYLGYLRNAPDLDTTLGSGVYKQYYLPQEPEAQNQWQYNQTRQSIISQLGRETAMNTPGVSAAQAYSDFYNRYTQQHPEWNLSLDELNEIKNYLYQAKGEINLEFGK